MSLFYPNIYQKNILSIDYKKLECVCKHYKIDMNKPFNKLTKKEQTYIKKYLILKI